MKGLLRVDRIRQQVLGGFQQTLVKRAQFLYQVTYDRPLRVKSTYRVNYLFLTLEESKYIDKLKSYMTTEGPKGDKIVGSVKY